jgi:hypothetical protein
VNRVDNAKELNMPAQLKHTILLRAALALWLLAAGATLRASEQSWTRLEARSGRAG